MQVIVADVYRTRLILQALMTRLTMSSKLDSSRAGINFATHSLPFSCKNRIFSPVQPQGPSYRKINNLKVYFYYLPSFLRNRSLCVQHATLPCNLTLVDRERSSLPVFKKRLLASLESLNLRAEFPKHLTDSVFKIDTP